MNKFNWKNTIKVNIFVLRINGLWPNGEFYQRDSYFAYFLSLITLLHGGFNLTQIIGIIESYPDLEAMTASLLLTATNILAFVKVCVFVKNLKMIKQLLNKLNTQQFRPNSMSEVIVISPTLEQWKKIYLCYLSIATCNLLMWSFAPFINDSNNKQLPFAAWFPCSIEKSPNYEIIYIFQLLCMWPITVTNVTLDSFNMALMTLISAQCDLLCHQLKHLGSNFYRKKLIRCIKRHKEILR